MLTNANISKLPFVKIEQGGTQLVKCHQRGSEAKTLTLLQLSNVRQLHWARVQTETKQFRDPDAMSTGMQAGRQWVCHVIVHCSAADSNSAWCNEGLTVGVTLQDCRLHVPSQCSAGCCWGHCP